MGENNRYSSFLRDLLDVCKKHSFCIDGCGCCGSPRVSEGIPHYAAIDIKSYTELEVDTLERYEKYLSKEKFVVKEEDNA